MPNEVRYRHRGLRQVSDYIIQRSLVQAVGRARHVFSKNAPTVYLLCHHPVKIVGLERYLSEMYFENARALWAANQWEALGGDHKRIDILGLIAGRFSLNKKNGDPNEEARNIKKKAVELIETRFGVTLEPKRIRRGYEVQN